MTAIALTIAGSDSGGGAGIQADLKTFSALGVYGASVLTAVTAQNTRAVTAVEMVSARLVKAQIAAVLDDLAVGAIKIGMLGDPQVIRAVAEGLRGCAMPVVLDPVMVAKSGDRLLAAEAVSALRDELLPLATLLTPNLPEAAALLEPEAAPDAVADTPAAQGRALLAMGPDWVLMKGGHAAGAVCTDLLIGPEDRVFRAPRIATRNTHGTGCTLSAAIAAGLAQGMDMPQAVARAHDYLQSAIAAADRLRIGSGHGPVHHFHAFWMEPAWA
ncbi:bifunctional hydroxymethylpyrimidine kinase/phosphomethylpyrimidine kinase [uncultured Paracoccus sp.]|uniref:bifunctional hydroxymethylpyrimidine kinase/phosphomethylpyrimidine kinase n=1 Tax=Paracoccus sp. S1E-3 TaxID=2756130 RepID=UPI0015EF4AB1|nr:bifunctional hydroxymethylpyrimidine kinase/phosphomethylpyrimidine kinase [uncultured Paracoccus sp.]MBA4489237.1 bifunctional hydroxymethylpyrimidine kinase/phosphomethylpyrimidine kinase [Paracoccus sp. S1E-3]